MTRKKKKLLYVLIIIVLALFLAIAFLYRFTDGNIFKMKGKEEIKSEEELFEEMLRERENEIVYSFDENFENGREWSEDDFKQLARSFAERFGSFSNQSDYSNIDDLRILMSSNMKKWADNYTVDLRSDRDHSANFYGITSRALIEPTIDSFDIESSKIEVMVSTQREESSLSGKNNVYQQEILITFVKEGGEWLVDSAFWQ